MRHIEGEEAMNIFNLVVRNKLLPAKLEDLIPMSFIGQAAVEFCRTKIKALDQLNATEEQRKATLKDGQDAGEMLLDIEARIGQLLPKTGEHLSVYPRNKNGHTIKPSEAEVGLGFGLSEYRARTARTIAANPTIVARVKAEARAREDIPTRTAVMSQIALEREKTRRIDAEKIRDRIEKETRAIIAVEEAKYLNALDRCIAILPHKPPKNWGEKAFRTAKAKAEIIIKRLEVFE